MLLPLVTAPYLSRILGVEGIGKYSFNYAITFYFMILAKMGLINYGTRQISFVRDNRVKLNKTFSSIYYSQLCISLIVFFSYIIYIFIFSKDFLVSLTFSIMVFASIFDIDWLYSGLEKFKSIS